MGFSELCRRASRMGLRIATLISLVLLIAAGVLWIRTYAVSYSYFHAARTWPRDGNHFVSLDVDMSMGELSICVATYPPLRPPPPPPIPTGPYIVVSSRTITIPAGWRSEVPFALDQYDDAWHGFRGRLHIYEPGDTSATVLLPWWFVMLISGILPMSWYMRSRRRVKRVPGICRRCAYDLTGNVSGVCPECGTAVAQSPEAAT